MFSIVLKVQTLVLLGLFIFVLLSDWRTLTYTFTERIRLYKLRKERAKNGADS